MEGGWKATSKKCTAGWVLPLTAGFSHQFQQQGCLRYCHRPQREHPAGREASCPWLIRSWLGCSVSRSSALPFGPHLDSLLPQFLSCGLHRSLPCPRSNCHLPPTHPSSLLLCYRESPLILQATSPWPTCLLQIETPALMCCIFTVKLQTVWNTYIVASLAAQRVKHPPEVRETQVWSLGREDPLEKEMATHSSIPAWRILWTEEPGGL